jgi:hypothetical protein
MLGWWPGSRPVIVPAEGQSAEVYQAIEDVTAQYAQISHGLVQPVVAPREPTPVHYPNEGEITIEPVSQEEMDRICRGAAGCCEWSVRSSGEIFRARLTYVATAGAPIVAHELGHAFGLLHILARDGAQPAYTMGITPDRFAPGGQRPRFDPATVNAATAVYDRGLVQGKSYLDFLGAGLIDGAAATGTHSGEKAPMPEEGDDDVRAVRICD